MADQIPCIRGLDPWLASAVNAVTVGAGLAREAFGVLKDAFAGKPCSYRFVVFLRLYSKR